MSRAGLIFLLASVTALLLTQPVGAGSLTSVMTDPEGDASFPFSMGVGVIAPAYLDVVRVTVSVKGGSFVFTMEVAGLIPETPVLSPPEVALLQWAWGLSTLEANPCGFPLPPGYCYPTEYDVTIFWDGTGFTGVLIDRTPLLTGGEAIVTPLPFAIKGAEFKMSVDAATVGNPSSFLWGAAAEFWSAPFGSWGTAALDRVCCATWPT